MLSTPHHTTINDDINQKTDSNNITSLMMFLFQKER